MVVKEKGSKKGEILVEVSCIQFRVFPFIE
jgi:hypothetical protein